MIGKDFQGSEKWQTSATVHQLIDEPGKQTISEFHSRKLTKELNYHLSTLGVKENYVNV